MHDAAGTPLALPETVQKLELGFGGADALAIAASGRIWWNLHVRDSPQMGFLELPYLLVLHE